MALYRQRGADFLLQAFNDPSLLETATGLRQMQLDTDASGVLSDFSDTEDGAMADAD